jgi:hypothetical protein
MPLKREAQKKQEKEKSQQPAQSTRRPSWEERKSLEEKKTKHKRGCDAHIGARKKILTHIQCQTQHNAK